ncbi:MAG: POTRA domain-containing protein [Rhizobacter sp.]
MNLHKYTMRAPWAFALALAALPVAKAQDAAPAAPAPAASAAASPAPVEEVLLDILEFVVEGNTVLPTRDIERALMPYLGPNRSFKDVESARKALEDVYQRIGYQTVFVEVPEQRVNAGVIHLRVAEGRVERTRVTGGQYFEQGQIRRAASELAEGSVPDFSKLQTQLAQLNRSADRQVAPVLRPGRTPGTVEVELSVKDRSPLHGDVELNNRASPFTTESRLNASIRYDNLWQRQHSFGLSVQTSPQKTSEVKLLVGTYLWNMADRPDVVSIYALRSKSGVSLVGGTTVLGDASIGGVRWILPIIGGSEVQQTLSAGFDVKSFGQTKVVAGATEAPVLQSTVYSPLSLSYSGSRPSPGQLWQFSLTLNTAPPGVLGNSDERFSSRRSVARAGYVALKYELSHESMLSKSVGSFIKIDGQFTDDPLIPNEQATLGGAESIRGYRESEVAGDRSFRGSAELRYFPWGAANAEQPTTAYVLGFFEGARAWLIEPLGPQAARSSIASTGFGLRVQNWRGFKLSADAARALRNGLIGADGPVTKRGEWRGLVSVSYAF